MENYKEKYRRIEDASLEELYELKKKVDSCPWRQNFHVQPTTGLLNDPNGLSFYEGEYHLFYQWHPLGPVHGLKYWYHTKSKDLVHWENVGIGIAPDSIYDRQGAYSGSAIEHEGKLYLMYTGNTRDQHMVRHPYQCIASMDKNGCTEKFDNPVIDHVPNGYTEHFRDPKVWKEGDRFYSVIGAQRTNNTGCIVLYSSPNLVDWTFEGELETGLKYFGYMWECPDYFVLQGHGVLIFSPQGIEPVDDKYRNIYQSGYILGQQLDIRSKKMIHDQFMELDRGFDFYAPQTMLSPDGRRILIGWMGLPEVEYPTDQNGWAHCLTIPRELSVKKGKLIQKPVREIYSLRQKESRVADTLNDEVKVYDGFKGKQYELICEFRNTNADIFGIEILASESEKTVIKYNAKQEKMFLDRSLSGQNVGVEYGTERTSGPIKELMKLHIFVDTSSVEIFVNDGEEVFTSRVFPDEGSEGIRFFAHGGQVLIQAKKWDYEKMNSPRHP